MTQILSPAQRRREAQIGAAQKSVADIVETALVALSQTAALALSPLDGHLAAMTSAVVQADDLYAPGVLDSFTTSEQGEALADMWALRLSAGALRQQTTRDALLARATTAVDASLARWDELLISATALVQRLTPVATAALVSTCQARVAAAAQPGADAETVRAGQLAQATLTQLGVAT